MSIHDTCNHFCGHEWRALEYVSGIFHPLLLVFFKSVSQTLSGSTAAGAMALKRLKSQYFDDLAMLELMLDSNSSTYAELMMQPVLKSCPPNVDSSGVSQNASISVISPLFWLSNSQFNKPKQSQSPNISHSRTDAALANDEDSISGALAQTQSQTCKSEPEQAHDEGRAKTVEELLAEGPWE